MEFKKRQLDNGLVIIGEVNKNALSAGIGFFTRTGSRDETNSISGVSHFLEHMLFKGTDKLSWLDVNQAFDRTGAKFNAFTSEENTVYYAAVLPEYLAEVTNLWSELMRPALRDDDFEIEKNVIKEEIAMYKDMPQFDVIDQARSLYFSDHPCGNSVLGTNQSIDDLKAEQMREYFGRRYAPNNMVVAIAGNFDFEQMCSLIEKKCGQWQKQSAERKLEDFEGSSQKKKLTKSNLVCDHICLVSRTVSVQDDRKYAASLLSNIVGDCTGSRYFWQLIDSAIADEASMQCETMDGTGAMYSYIKCAPDKTSRVMEIVDSIFADTANNGITEDELQKAKNKILSAITIKNELPMGRLIELGFNWIYLSKYKSIDDIVSDVKAVSVKDVNTIAAEYRLGDYTMLSIGPGE